MPVGRRCSDLQSTRGHFPKSPFLYLSSCTGSNQVTAPTTYVWTYHLCQASCCSNVSSVHKAIKMSGRLFYRFSHLIIAVEIKDIGHKIQRILVVLDIGIQSSQIEAVCQVVFVDLAKVFVATRGYELRH